MQNPTPPKLNLIKGDCLAVMKELIAQNITVDFILTDPPYGVLDCHWDSVIPMDEMFDCLLKLIRPDGAIALFGMEPFSSRLRLSHPELFKYDWIWLKNAPTGFLNAKNKPLYIYEIISVFSQGATATKSANRMRYFPQDLIKIPPHVNKPKRKVLGDDAYQISSKVQSITEYANYPANILRYDKPTNPVHPTQKPVPLLEYLIKTYTLPGETVLDFTMGSGSTGVAAKHTERSFIGIELTDRYFDIATHRIASADNAEQLTLEL